MESTVGASASPVLEARHSKRHVAAVVALADAALTLRGGDAFE